MKWCSEWNLVLRAVTSESFAENGCVGPWLVWADWRGRFSLCPRLYLGGVVLGVPGTIQKFLLLHHLGLQLMSSGTLHFLLLDTTFPWFARFSSTAMVIDEVQFCKGIHNVIWDMLLFGFHTMVQWIQALFYSCVFAWCKFLDPAMLWIWFLEHPVYTMFWLNQL